MDNQFETRVANDGARYSYYEFMDFYSDDIIRGLIQWERAEDTAIVTHGPGDSAPPGNATQLAAPEPAASHAAAHDVVMSTLPSMEEDLNSFLTEQEEEAELDEAICAAAADAARWCAKLRQILEIQDVLLAREQATEFVENNKVSSTNKSGIE